VFQEQPLTRSGFFWAVQALDASSRVIAAATARSSSSTPRRPSRPARREAAGRAGAWNRDGAGRVESGREHSRPDSLFRPGPPGPRAGAAAAALLRRVAAAVLLRRVAAAALAVAATAVVALGAAGPPPRPPRRPASPPPSRSRASSTRGGDWYGNQTTCANLLAAARERLGIPIAAGEEAVVAPLDEALFRHPLLYLAGHGNVKFSAPRSSGCAPTSPAAVSSGATTTTASTPPSAASCAACFPSPNSSSCPSAIRSSTRRTSSRGFCRKFTSTTADRRAPSASHDGRLVVLYTFDTDLSDGMEDEGTHPIPREA